MKEATKRALETDRLIDITTTGRRTGQPHRIEIGFHFKDEELFITGTPGPRGWLANLAANSRFTIHLKQSLQVDLPAVATLVSSEARRREVFTEIAERRRGRQPLDVEAWVKDSPLVQVELLPE
jgi:deazaflavin-dependent oxidoreductase (nitroreductase family)